MTVVAPAPGRDGASWVAAGMLAPVTEAQFGESALTALLLEGARRWPDFAAALEDATGHDVGYDTTGTVTVALDASDRASLDDLLAYQHAARPCAPNAAARRSAAGSSPRSARRCAAASMCPATTASTTVRSWPHSSRRAEASGVYFEHGAVSAVAAGPELVLTDGRRLHPGPRCRGGRGRPAGHRRTGRGRGLLGAAWVKGHILRLGPAPGTSTPLLTRTVRGLVRGHSVYLVPRPDGSLVVGATVEERGTDTTVQAGAVHELLCDARAIVPGVDELELRETAAALPAPARPTTRRASAGADSAASCSPPVTIATGSCWRP